jgi:3-oxoacyl-[acyl-carrier protein] reductase
MAVAVITGASRGIGRAIAERFAAGGYDVFLVARDRGSLEALTIELGHSEVDCAYYACDLLETGIIDRVARECERRFGRADVLVNNAGVAPRATFRDSDHNLWERTLALNARVPFFLTQRLLPLLLEAKPGYVINVASVVAKKGYPHQSIYTASKHALLGWTKALAQEIPTEALRVHALLPGGVATDMIREVRPDIDASALIAPEEVASVAFNLAQMSGNAMIDEVEIRRQSKST